MKTAKQYYNIKRKKLYAQGLTIRGTVRTQQIEFEGKLYPNRQVMARHFGITSTTVYRWLRAGRRMTKAQMAQRPSVYRRKYGQSLAGLSKKLGISRSAVHARLRKDGYPGESGYKAKQSTTVYYDI